MFSTSRGLDSFDQYLQDVEKYPLIQDPAEERALARRARVGDKEAAERLVTANLRFVISYVKKYQGRGLGLAELVCIGNEGLLKAVKKFDPDRGYRLISYAVWWIRAQIHEYIMRSWSLVKLGSGRLKRKLFFKLRSERSRIEQEAARLGESASKKDLAASLGVSEELVSEMEGRMAARDFSLDAPMGEDGASHLEMVPDSEPTQEDLVGQREEHKLLTGVIAEATEKLDEKERYILDHRLLSDEPETLAQIGSHYGVSRERARQIESKVLDKLRAKAKEMHVLPAPA
jgi:RNA polymerase sigma-32 factor